MGIQPRRVNQLVKQLYRIQGLRASKGPAGLQAKPFRENRGMPTSRAARGAGVSKYYHAPVDAYAEAHPREVCVPLHSHIGAPARAIVALGETVAAGQVIASCPENALGAAYHAPIDGVVTGIGDCVRIERSVAQMEE
jgi:hypothetical protein